MNLRGELTSKQIITLVILIVSFAVILIFFLALNLKSEINTETCRNSVILRGTDLGKTTRLNCETEDVCFSKTKECESPADKIIKISSKSEFLDEATDLMYDCFWMMGEGKVDYSPHNFFLTGKNYCAMCSRIYFDSSLEGSDFIKVSNADLYSFLKGKRVPNGENNMLFEMYRMNSVDSVFAQLEADNEELRDLDIAGLDVFAGGKKSAIVTSITKEGTFGSFISLGGVGAAAGVILVFVPVVGPAALITVAGISTVVGLTTVGGVTGILVDGFIDGAQVMPPTYYPYEEDVLKQLDCKEFSTLS